MSHMLAGVEGAAPTGSPHFVVEAADPRSPLRVARTYFSSQGVCVRDVFAGQSIGKEGMPCAAHALLR